MPAADLCSAVTPPVTLRRCLMSCVTHVSRLMALRAENAADGLVGS